MALSPKAGINTDIHFKSVSVRWLGKFHHHHQSPLSIPEDESTAVTWLSRAEPRHEVAPLKARGGGG